MAVVAERTTGAVPAGRLNVVLVVPPASLSGSYGALKDFSNPQPSIGLAYLAAVARQKGFAVSVLDAYVEQLTEAAILERMAALRPDVVGVSVLTTGASVAQTLVKALRRRFPGLRLILGNLHASLFAEDFLGEEGADAVVHGEGEHAFVDVLEAVERGSDLLAVPGLSVAREGRVVSTGPRPLIDDLDALPFPAWDAFPLERYASDPRTAVRPGQVERLLLATRGCPNACTFCSSRNARSMGSRYRMRSPKSVADEMEFLGERFGAKVLAFMDLAFPLVKEHALAVFDEMVRRGLPDKFVWVTECRVKPLDLETLQAMRRAGCVRVNFGLESGSDDVLAALRKNFTVADAERAVRLARQVGLEVDGMFMMGLPLETEAHVRRTIEFALRLDVRYAIFNLFVPYPGSELYDTLRAAGQLRDEAWADFTSYPTWTGGRPVFVPTELTHERLMALQEEAMRRFYLRPRFILQELLRFKPSKLRHYWSGLRGLVCGRR